MHTHLYSFFLFVKIVFYSNILLDFYKFVMNDYIAEFPKRSKSVIQYADHCAKRHKK